MRRRTALAAVVAMTAALVASCGTPGAGTDPVRGVAALGAADPTVRLLVGGDVMLGRDVASLLAVEGPEVWAGIRHLVGSADLAMANLESPLTSSIEPGRVSELGAASEAASHLARAGFDLMGVANNHACDTGPAGMADTRAALEEHGIVAVGATLSAVPVAVGPVSVAVLAFDLTGGGAPCVPAWDSGAARSAVAAATRRADVVVVGIHGGVEGLPRPDPVLERITSDVASWGADVVWGHGSHVAYPVGLSDPDGDGRPTVIAPGLGNLLFDQAPPASHRGELLEVMAGRDGVVAYRVGWVDHADGLLRFDGWEEPTGDALATDGEWWSLAVRPDTAPPEPIGDLAAFDDGDLVDAACGDITGDGVSDVVAAFRRPAAVTEVNRHFPERRWADAQGRTAHLGVYEPGTLDQQWVAGTLFAPVGEVAACDGAVAVAYTTLDAPTIEATGAWFWSGFGFRLSTALPGPGRPRCADVDGDGSTEPVILDRRRGSEGRWPLLSGRPEP